MFLGGLLPNEEVGRGACCAGKKRKPSRRRATAIWKERFATLSEVERNKARQELHKLATAVCRRARGKVR